MSRANPEPRYWIAVASRDHVMTGVAGAFAQANHGKRAPMARMNQGDGLIYYSSKEAFGQQTPCQKFTAIGEVVDEEPYVGVMVGSDFAPYRRNIRYFSAQEVPIRPLLVNLDFIPDPRHWGYPFRMGFFEISAADYELIAQNMLNG